MEGSERWYKGYAGVNGERHKFVQNLAKWLGCLDLVISIDGGDRLKEVDGKAKTKKPVLNNRSGRYSFDKHHGQNIFLISYLSLFFIYFLHPIYINQ